MQSIRRQMMHSGSTHVEADYNTAQPPPMVGNLVTIGIAGLIGSGLLRYVLPTGSMWLADAVFFGSLVFFIPRLILGYLIWRIGGERFAVRDEIARSIDWRGDEQILDVGTGSGVILFESARHLTTGKGIGVDIYEPNTGGGTAHLFMDNAKAEGVADRVELKVIDGRKLPFEDQSFDLVTSSLALHHMTSRSSEGKQAVYEMLRVLKPGGTIALYDVKPIIDGIAQLFKENNVKIIRQRGRTFSFILAQK